jgi:hypothetical protein
VRDVGSEGRRERERERERGREGEKMREGRYDIYKCTYIYESKCGKIEVSHSHLSLGFKLVRRFDCVIPQR